jgi:hypothetical protein
MVSVADFMAPSNSAPALASAGSRSDATNHEVRTEDRYWEAVLGDGFD